MYYYTPPNVNILEIWTSDVNTWCEHGWDMNTWWEHLRNVNISLYEHIWDVYSSYVITDTGLFYSWNMKLIWSCPAMECWDLIQIFSQWIQVPVLKGQQVPAYYTARLIIFIQTALRVLVVQWSRCHIQYQWDKGKVSLFSEKSHCFMNFLEQRRNDIDT